MLIKGFYSLENIEEQEEHKLIAQIKLNKDHEIYNGHFPGNPIVPGVVLTQIVKEVIESQFNETLFMEAADNIKFMAIVNPEKNDTIFLNLDIKRPDNETIKVSNTTFFEETIFFKLKATFKIV